MCPALPVAHRPLPEADEMVGRRMGLYPVRCAWCNQIDHYGSVEESHLICQSCDAKLLEREREQLCQWVQGLAE